MCRSLPKYPSRAVEVHAKEEGGGESLINQYRSKAIAPSQVACVFEEDEEERRFIIDLERQALMAAIRRPQCQLAQTCVT